MRARRLVGAIDRVEDASGELDLLAAALRREIERFKPLQPFGGEEAAHVGVDEVVLHDAEPPRHLFVGDAQLVEALAILLRKEPQEVVYELLVVEL